MLKWLLLSFFVSAPDHVTAVVNGNDATVVGRVEGGRIYTTPLAAEPGPITFTNVTETAITSASPGTDSSFWSGIEFINGDGCPDLFIGTHSDNDNGTPPGGNSSMFLQDNVNGVCQGTFIYYDRRQTTPVQTDCNTGYSQDQSCNGLNNRITSRYGFWNLNNDPDGLPSFFGQDADGNPSSLYAPRDAATPGGLPLYQEFVGCPGVRSLCVLGDLDPDNAELNFITSAQSGADPRTIEISRINVDGTTRAVSTTILSRFSNDRSRQSLIFDVDGDTWPDIVNVSPLPRNAGSYTSDGYWRFDPVTKGLTRVNNVFSDPWFIVEDPTCRRYAGTHQNWIDYDSDGDMDLLFGSGVYDNNNDGSGNCGVVRGNKFYYALYRNDGNGVFVDVTVASQLSTADFRNQFYFSTYLGTQIADIDNDGCPDIIYGGSSSAGNTIAYARNNCDGTFAAAVRITTPNNDSLRPWTNVGDYNNDGLIDLIYNSTTGTKTHITLLRNDTSSPYHWMQVKARGQGNNVDGLHTQFTWLVPNTSTVITTRMIGDHARGQNEVTSHAGLRNHSVVDLRVQFPHDSTATASCLFEDVVANKFYVVFDPRVDSRGCIIEEYTPGSGPWPIQPSTSMFHASSHLQVA